MRLEITDVSQLVLPAFITVAVLMVGRSITVYLKHYATFPKDSKKLEEAKRNGKVASLEDIPGTVGYPFVSIIPQLLPYLRIRRNDLFFYSLLDKYGDFCKILRDDKYLLLTADPAILKTIANSESFIRKDFFQSVARDIAPYALFLIPDGDLWKKHRKGLQPAFGPIHLKNSCRVAIDVADHLFRVWDSDLEAGNCTRNVINDFTMLTADVIARVVFSLDFDGVKSLETHSEAGFHSPMSKVVTAIQTRFAFRARKYLWGWFGASEAQLAPSVQYITSILKNAIEMKKQSKLAEQSEDTDDKWNRDLLDRLLEPQGSFTFTEEEIMSEMFGFFLAGHESTANTLTWAMLELAQHPEIAAKLQQEIDSELGSQPPSYEQVTSLKYVDAFVKETLRLHPVASLFGRSSDEDVQLTSSDGVKILVPKDVTVIICVSKVHESKKFWGEDASEFNPDRWLIKNGDKIEEFVPVPGSFLPFWDGPHNCIGQKIAMIEAKITIIRMMQKFNVRLSPKQGPIQPVYTITLGLKNGLLVDVSKRA
ncbi:hypothetical protein HK098_004092 [Nowakowskiella sp. JEL0407]|nr:hypothetical protein HK098_004092 [Nowakowskiella sp. JEL0407]